MKKEIKAKTLLISILFYVLCLGTVNAQTQLWYENASDTKNIVRSRVTRCTFADNALNPNTSGINTNTRVSRIITEGEDRYAYVYFNLPTNIITLTDLEIRFQAYLNINATRFSTENSKIILLLKNSKTGNTLSEEFNFKQTRAWQQFRFYFDENTIPNNEILAGGYDQIIIGMAKDSNPISLFVDRIVSTHNMQRTANPNMLSGSWGVTFPIFGGERLDLEVAGGYDYLSGAQQIVDELTEVDHIITNLSNFAHSHYFTLRSNPHLDVANEIDESFVPSAENEKIILDVIDIFRKAGKKIILYISTSYFDRADEEVQLAWQNYYNREFGGDEYLAYEFVCSGFIKRVKNITDGYWLDTGGILNADGKYDDFVAMVKATDPDATISAGLTAKYLEENGNNVQVDTDGLDDEDETDYNIVLFEPLNTYQDFTSGHITPLGQGAPPNSWAYDEFTLPNMIKEPWYVFDEKPIIKHGWFPIRSRWHSPAADLMFEVEQAYRFVKSITDAGAAVTFANTTDNGVVKKGHMMKDEMDIMKEINRRLSRSNVPDYEPYVRPQGAFLVGEEQWFPWYENEVITNEDYISQYWAANGLVKVNLDNPFKMGINESEKVTRFLRDGNNPAKVFFNLPNPITDLTSFKISLDAFLNIPADEFDASGSNLDTRIRVYLSSSKTGTTIYKQLNLSTRRVWENLVFDFSGMTIINRVRSTGGFDRMSIGFANGDTNGSNSIYYFDNVQGTINQNVDGTASKVLISNEIATSDFINVYPNPIVTSFSTDSNEDLKSATIYSLSGKKIKEFSTAQEAYDIKELSSGVYILKVVTEQASIKVIRILKE